MGENEIVPEEKHSIRIRNMLASIERTFLPVDHVIGKYRIIEEIDRGGMAVVYKATQLDLDRIIALKVMPANISINHGFVERFLTEAHAIAKLNHTNIVKIHEVATEDNIYYLAMEYIPGKNLYYYLHYYKPKLVDVLEIVIRLTEALSYAHSQKIIHRDLKLNNVIMRDMLNPVLIDFGLAKAMENDEKVRPGITRTGEIMGSPSYMAPERLLGGPVDHRSDICSLGIMLYEMLTFKNPYLDQRNLHQTTMNVMESNPIPPRRLVPWLPIEIEAITLKAMAKDPSNRYQTMDEFRTDLVRYQHGDPISARPPSIYSKVQHFTKRHWVPLVIGSIIVCFSALFISTLYIQSKKEQSHWQLIFNDNFDKKSIDKYWIFKTDSSNSENRPWEIINDALSGNTSNNMYALLDKHINRDILIECDIIGNPKDIYNAGIFLYGNQPDSSYCFYVNKDGTGVSGIAINNNPFLFREVKQNKIRLTCSNHVRIEQIHDCITFSINGTVVTKLYENLPSLGRGHDKAGVFIQNGSARFDNFKVYRRAIPKVPSPTLIADRFFERGDFEGALDEYNGLLVDFANDEIVKEVKLKIADCLVRLKRYNEAEEVVKSCRLLITDKNDMLIPRLHFIQSVIKSSTGKENEADHVLTKIAVDYPESGVNQAYMNSVMIHCMKNLKSNQPDSAEKKIFTLRQYPQNSYKILHLYDALLDYFSERHLHDSTIAIAQRIIKKGTRNDPVVIEAKVNLAYAYLNKGKTGKAKEIFDQIITGNANSERIWDALSGMAEVNIYDFKYQEAMAIYKKIFNEGPKAMPVTWRAGIEFAIGLQKNSLSESNSVFSVINNGDHPFPIPRLIAQYFLGSISTDYFENEWKKLLPENPWYFYYLARREHLSGNEQAALKSLKQLRNELSKKEWNYFRVLKFINNYSRW